MRLVFASTVTWVCLIHSVAAAREQPSRFAIVIGNNQPEHPKQVTLRYADDDALATHQLLQEAGVESVLLVSPDFDTRALDPGSKHVQATLAKLESATAQIEAKVRAVRARGGGSELFIFYSGHGDEDDAGEGYVLLEGKQRFTSAMLVSLLRRVAADRNHVVIDACKSSLFVFNRGRGGDHRPYTKPPLAISSPELRANTGFVLSTASGRESHEWEGFHAGILSHEVRSALRGAADLDHDGQISYRELRGFLGNANEAINPRFRPDFLVQPPDGDDADRALLSWSCPSSIELADLDWGHVYVETARGDRIADLHPAPGRSTYLWTPRERPLFVKRDDERLEYPVTEAGGTQRVAPSHARIPALGRRGAPSLAFENLFASPFVPADLERFAHTSPISPSEAPLTDAAPDRRALWIALGSTAVFGALTLTSGLLTLQQNERFHEAAGRVEDERAKGRTLQTLTNIGLGLTCTAAATALTLYFIEPSSGADSTRLSIAPGWIGIHGRM